MLLLTLSIACDQTAAPYVRGYEDGRAAGKAEAEAEIDAIIDERLASYDARISELETALQESGYATEDWVGEQGYATQTSLEDYATDADLSDAVATQAGVDAAQDAALEGAIASQADVDATQDDALTDAVAAQAVVNATEDAALATLEGAHSALAVRLDAIEADYVVSADVEDVVRLISSDETWTIDQYGTGDYATLDAAIAALDAYRIGAEATVTIQLDAGAYSFTEALTFHHPDGGRVEVVGDTTDPGNVNLTFSGTDGVVVDEGSALGYFGGFSLHGDTLGYGLAVRDSSWAEIGELEIEGFPNGIEVSGASNLGTGTTAVAGWLTIHDVAGSCVIVSEGSASSLDYVDCADAGESGIRVTESSFLYAPYATSVRAADSCIEVGGSSYADLTYSESSECDGGIHVGGTSSAGLAYAVVSGVLDGVTVSGASFADASYATVDGSGRYGFNVGLGAAVNAQNSDSNGGTAAYGTQMNGYIVANNTTGGTTVYTWGHDTSDFVHGL